MRLVYIVLLVIILAAIVIFALQNDDRVTLRFFEWRVTLPVAILIAAAYVLGMVSGWSVFGFLRRSIKKVAESRMPARQ
jgi:uncharacterized integral membrane protein